MIFLIEYNRPTGSMVSFRHFKNSEQAVAQQERLKLELNLKAGNIRHEVVLLEAANEKALRKTHRRYFDSIKELGKSVNDDAA